MFGKVCLCLCISFFFSPFCFSQNTPAPVATPTPVPAPHKPEPYNPTEFDPFWLDIRRAEILAVGSFPFSMFLASESYEIFRYFASGNMPSYSPWPFRDPSGPGFLPDEQKGIIIGAISLSIAFALTDFLLGKLIPPHPPNPSGLK